MKIVFFSICSDLRDEVEGMDTEKILFALQERDRWIERETDLKREMRGVSKEEKGAKQEELERIKEQIAYYDALARDMKKSVKPSKLSHLMNSLLHI
jgi:archaellum component FlaC